MAGRLWCGFACPQTVYTEIFLWIEHRIEGDRSARLRLDNGGWTAEKLREKSAKQSAWIAVSLWTASPSWATSCRFASWAPSCWRCTAHGRCSGCCSTASPPTATLASCANRCASTCARTRASGIVDKDTLIVTYDTQRGEPRGARSKAHPKATGLGDCIDCSLCVQVCPVGINIRNGLQYERIGCGLVDSCNSVMDKVGAPRGLIRYATPNGMASRWSTAQMLRRVARPRVLIYVGALRYSAWHWWPVRRCARP